jgi:hypothetical protein
MIASGKMDRISEAGALGPKKTTGGIRIVPIITTGAVHFASQHDGGLW